MIGGAHLTVFFGLLASLMWGAGDFSGGVASKRLPAIAVVTIVYVSGFLAVLALAILSGEPPPAWTDFAWGGLAGLTGGGALLIFYRALAEGKMSLVAPIAGVLSAAVPVAFGMLTVGMPAHLQLLGFGLGIVSVWMVSWTGGELRITGSVGQAVIAGLGFGTFLVLIAHVEAQIVFWQLVAARAGSALVLLVVAGWTKTALIPRDKKLLALPLLTGILDMLGNLMFILAERSGRLDIAAVSGAFYPAVTVILAWIILKEHMKRTHLAGVIVALVAIVLISIG